MPGKRKRTKSSKTFRKRRRTSYKSKSSMIYKTVKPELKAVDNYGTATIVDSAGVATLNRCGQGTDRHQRIGKKTLMKSLEISMYLQNTGQTLLRTVFGLEIPRIMIILDRKPTPTSPSLGEILRDIDSTGTGQTIASSMPNLDNKKRFKFLLNWEPILPSYTREIAGDITNVGGQIDPLTHTFSRHFYIKLNKVCSFRDITDSLGSIEENAIHLVAVGFHILATAPYLIRWNARTRYIDC